MVPREINKGGGGERKGAPPRGPGACSAEQPPGADTLQPPLRSGFRVRLRRSVSQPMYRPVKKGERKAHVGLCVLALATNTDSSARVRRPTACLPCGTRCGPCIRLSPVL